MRVVTTVALLITQGFILILSQHRFAGLFYLWCSGYCIYLFSHLYGVLRLWDPI